MPLLQRSNGWRAIGAAVASVALVVASTVALAAPASADTPPTIGGYPAQDYGQTVFVAQTSTGCSYGVDEYANFYYDPGWVQMPAGVHHAKVTAVGEAGRTGDNGGAAGGLGGGISAIVPAYPGQIFYASPTSSVTQERDGNIASGGHASFISTISPTTALPTNDPIGPDPNSFCNSEFDPFLYPATMPSSALVLVAGGGGGGGDNSGSGAGGNAGPNGSNGGGNYNLGAGAGGGGGGTQSGGGQGGRGGRLDGYAGSYLAGGSAFGPDVTGDNSGGGGGGGYFGGGSGGIDTGSARGGGGGGSNYVMPLPSDGLSKVLSNGTSTQASQVSIVPIYEPTVTISAPVNPSVVKTPTTIIVTVSGLPTAVPGRAGASGTVSLDVNGVEVQRSLDPLIGSDTGTRTATFTPTQLTAGDVSYTATYNGDTTQEYAQAFANIVEPESSNAFVEHYKPAVTAIVTGTMTYGDGTASFTHSESLPSGVTISGTVSCATADGGGALSTLSAANHPIDPASCSGLTLAGPNAANYGLLYEGSVTITPEPVTAHISGSQPTGGPPAFTDVISPASASASISGTPSCTTLQDGTSIGPSLTRGVYTLGTCTGLSLAGPDAGNYTLTVVPGQFISGASTPTLSIPTLAGAVIGSPLDTRVTLASGDNPGGDVSLSFFDSDSCTGAPLSVGSASVAGNGDYDVGTVTPQRVGDFSVKANYDGDTFNTAAATGCEVIAVAKAASGTTITTPATGVVGQPLSASVTLHSSVPRAGSADLRIFLLPSSDTSCAGSVTFISEDVSADSDGVYTSPSYTPTAPGTYQWVILYSGDLNHKSDFTFCALKTVVGSPPEITSSAAATFTAGTSGSFTVTTVAGSPATTALSESGQLPAGVTFRDNEDGTATLSGTPDAGAGGHYPVTLTANNGIGTAAVQTLVITVNEAPAITSANTWASTIGVTSSFGVTTAPGYPTAYLLTHSGTLPPGLSLTVSGGTATISGAPAGPAGDYPITLTASNGINPDTVQTLTITVADAPPVALPLVLPLGGGAAIGGVPRIMHSGQSFTATASGFAPGAPITWGVYSTPRILTTSVADANGNATAQLAVPVGFAGAHIVVASGIAVDGSPLFATAATTIIAPLATAATLPATGISVGESPGIAILLFVGGLAFLLVARIRRAGRRA